MTTHKVETENHPAYVLPEPDNKVNRKTWIDGVQVDENVVLEQAKAILRIRIAQPGSWITCPQDAKDLVVLELAEEPAEVFAVLWLNNKHGVLAFDRLFNGTIDGASVPPREVVRAAIKHNAAAAILVHNHPSGNTTPSQADERITERLKQALGLIDVRVLDHLIVGGTTTYSFAEDNKL
jgi:DNA repair protein RadC